jgi:hypothetical protein
VSFKKLGLPGLAPGPNVVGRVVGQQAVFSTVQDRTLLAVGGLKYGAECTAVAREEGRATPGVGACAGVAYLDKQRAHRSLTFWDLRKAEQHSLRLEIAAVGPMASRSLFHAAFLTQGIPKAWLPAPHAAGTASGARGAFARCGAGACGFASAGGSSSSGSGQQQQEQQQQQQQQQKSADAGSSEWVEVTDKSSGVWGRRRLEGGRRCVLTGPAVAVGAACRHPFAPFHSPPLPLAPLPSPCLPPCLLGQPYWWNPSTGETTDLGEPRPEGRLREERPAADGAPAAAAAAAPPPPQPGAQPLGQRARAPRDMTYVYSAAGILTGMVAGWATQYLD